MLWICKWKKNVSHKGHVRCCSTVWTVCEWPTQRGETEWAFKYRKNHSGLEWNSSVTKFTADFYFHGFIFIFIFSNLFLKRKKISCIFKGHLSACFWDELFINDRLQIRLRFWLYNYGSFIWCGLAYFVALLLGVRSWNLNWIDYFFKTKKKKIAFGWKMFFFFVTDGNCIYILWNVVARFCVKHTFARLYVSQCIIFNVWFIAILYALFIYLIRYTILLTLERLFSVNKSMFLCAIKFCDLFSI